MIYRIEIKDIYLYDTNSYVCYLSNICDVESVNDKEKKYVTSWDYWDFVLKRIVFKCV